MHQKRRFAKSLQHKATLMEEELRHDTAIIPDAPPPAPLTPATPPPPESLNQQPPAIKRAVRRLGIGDQQSAESSPPPALERSSSPASVQDWLPMDNHYPTPPPAPRKDQTPLSCSEYDAEYDSDGDPRSPPPLKIFHNGRVYFHKSYKGPKPLGFVNTRLYEGGCRDFFVAYTETELVWARRMDYVLRRHNL
jgi:hypothetical protein